MISPFDRFMLRLLLFFHPFLGRLPLSVRFNVYRYVRGIFEETAIEAYLLDTKDIGFFESFILGADELKRFAEEAKVQIQCFKRADMRGKFGACFLEPDDRLNRNEWKAVEDCILREKQKVVELLQAKGELIKYLGKRIVPVDESVYQLLEKAYRRYSIEKN